MGVTGQRLGELVAGPGWYKIGPPDTEQDTYVRLGETKTGRLVVTNVLVGALDGSDEVTARALRRVKIGAILDDIEEMLDPEDPDDLAGFIYGELRREMYRASGEKASPGRPRLTDDELMPTVEAYRKDPKQTWNQLADAVGVSASTAQRHVAEARSRGIL